MSTSYFNRRERKWIDVIRLQQHASINGINEYLIIYYDGALKGAC